MSFRKLSSIKSQLIFLITAVIVIFVAIGVLYYCFVSNLIHEKEEVYVRNLLVQVVENLQTSSDDMIRCAKMASSNGDTQRYLTAKTPLERFEAARGVSNSVLNITQEAQGISIAILGSTSALQPKPFLSILDALERDYGIYDLGDDETGFTGAIHNSYDNLTYYVYYQPILDIQVAAKLKNKIGTCLVMSTITRLEKCVSGVETTPRSILFLMDEEQNVITGNIKGDPQKLKTLSSASLTGRDGTVQRIDGEDYMVLLKEVPNTGWKAVSIIPVNEIDSDLIPFLQFGTVAIAGVLLLFILWGLHIFRSIASPVVEISKFVQKDAYSNLHTRLQVKSRNEVGMLSGQINGMLDKISEMTRTILQNQSNMYELDLAKKRAELSALQSQINPHFLYNTLECVKGYGYLLDSKEIVRIVESLSQMMRYCIKGPDVVTLGNELAIIESYQTIISIRFENRFRFETDVPIELYEARIPRFILQPIVENAVYHGLEPKYGGGVLRITGKSLPNDEVLLSVADDGIGMEDETLLLLNEQLSGSRAENLFDIGEGKGLALLNIHQRIRQFFGPGCGLRVESATGRGTSVQIKIRLLKD